MRAILIDDETLALDFLENQLNKIGQIDVVEKFNNFDVNNNVDLLKSINVVFLDIEMPGLNGLELADKILEVNAFLTIIFVTAYNEYAVQAFEVNALDYVLKPVQLKRLEKTVARILLQQAQLRDQTEVSEGDFYVNVCGELAFKQSTNNYKVLEWRTTKAKELFLYLLQHHGKTIHKSRLVELLWPDFDQDRAYSQLYTAIYHIRQALRRFHDHFSLQSVQEGYALFIHHVKIDVVEWEKKINNLPPINKYTIDDYEKAMELYSGPYLVTYDYLWAESERYRLEELWINSAYKIANYYSTNSSDFKKAEKWYTKICELRPENEDAHFELMKLYAEAGLGLLVDYQYKQLEMSLKDMGIGVSPQVEKWYNENRLSKI